MFEFTDRYDALGMNQPDPAKMCKGHCEGTGWVPVYYIPSEKLTPQNFYTEREDNLQLIFLWEEAHAEAHKFWPIVKVCWVVHVMEGEGNIFKRLGQFYYGIKDLTNCDGWHFVKCPTCGGTGINNT